MYYNWIPWLRHIWAIWHVYFLFKMIYPKTSLSLLNYADQLATTWKKGCPRGAMSNTSPTKTIYYISIYILYKFSSPYIQLQFNILKQQSILCPASTRFSFLPYGNQRKNNNQFSAKMKLGRSEALETDLHENSSKSFWRGSQGC